MNLRLHRTPQFLSHLYFKKIEYDFPAVFLHFLWFLFIIIFDINKVNDRLRKLAGGYTAPLNIFLSQELDAIQAVVTLVRTSLSVRIFSL
jgi:hypothetical protein